MKPWLWIPSEITHEIAPMLIPIGAFFYSQPQIYKWRSFNWRGLEFSNRLGIAGGVDKNGQMITSFWKLGSGFIEVGTVTPKPQPALPAPRLNRNIKEKALWNRLGFPSLGKSYVLANLKKVRGQHKTPIFINIGKNRDTPNESAHEDYLQLIEYFIEDADAYVINISSPNTKGLRELQGQKSFENLLDKIFSSKNSLLKPILIKLSPDQSEEELEATLLSSLKYPVAGWILTNTTLSRKGHWKIPETGGLSGAPLNELSRHTLQKAVNIVGDKREDRLIVSVGGILTPEEIELRLKIGADLVEVYTALVFEGLSFFRSTSQYFNFKK